MPVIGAISEKDNCDGDQGNSNREFGKDVHSAGWIMWT